MEVQSSQLRKADRAPHGPKLRVGNLDVDSAAQPSTLAGTSAPTLPLAIPSPFRDAFSPHPLAARSAQSVDHSFGLFFACLQAGVSPLAARAPSRTIPRRHRPANPDSRSTRK